MLRRAKGLNLFLSFVLVLSMFAGVGISSGRADAAVPIVIDGLKDPYWELVEVLGNSPSPGWEGFHIGELRMTSDDAYLYYYVSAVNVPNWGDNGMFIDIALNVNGVDSGADGNPWAAQFTYSGMPYKPQIHIVQRVKNDSEVNGAAVYRDGNLLLATWEDAKGAEFAVNRQFGFEGKIPLGLLGLQEGDAVYAHVTLSGNRSEEHGAFDTIPEDPGNAIAQSWNESGARNVQSVYATRPHVVGSETARLAVIGIDPANGAADVPVNLDRITVRFNDTIALSGSDSPSVTDADSTLSVSGDTLVFDLDGDLAYGRTYTVTIPAGSVEGVLYGALDRTLTFSFSTPAGPSMTYRVHYYRYDGKQLNWDMWAWIDGQEGKEFGFTGLDEDGFAVGEIRLPADAVNVITRPGNWSQQEPDRRIVMPPSRSEVDVWIIEGVTTVFYSKEEADVSPRVRAALMDSISTIDVVTTHEIDGSKLNDFTLFNVTRSETVDVAAVSTGASSVRLTVLEPGKIDVRDLYEVRHPEFRAGRVTMRRVLDDPRFYYGGNDLGLTYAPSGSTFKVWAPTAADVRLALYDDAGTYNAAGIVEDHAGGTELPMNRESNGVWSVHVSGDLAGKYYMYRAAFADGTVHYAVDPYARAVAANGARTAIVPLDATDPADWHLDAKPAFLNPTDAIVYELHVRDFSIHAQSGMAHKGKYLAFTETGLKDANGNSLGIDHLAELGVTHVHLLPVYDFKTVNELTVDDPSSDDPKFNWGYDPQNYNVPEGSYSTNPRDPAVRITEFKQMVKALHDEGIRVIMDVVYNHTFEIENGPFNKLVPGYFYRTDQTGRYTNGSGVGNEIATERPMVRKYIKDSVRYWAEEYHIDGFRFDLMGLIDTTTMAQIVEELRRDVDPTLLFYGEPWTGGSSPLAEQTLKGSQRGKGFAVFNDHFRGAIKGDSDGAGKGFATGAAFNEGGIVTGVRGAIDDFTDAPTETINYVTAHDNLNLWDKVIKTQGLDQDVGFLNIRDGVLIGGGSVEDAVAAADPHKYVDRSDVFANETVRRSLLANGIVLTAQGIPFIHAGDEMLRSKYGDHNSYKSPDAVNMIRWNLKAEFRPVFDYYAGLIKLRKAHPAFRMTTRDAVNAHLEVMRSDYDVVAFRLKDNANGDTWRNIVVIYNANPSDQTVALPAVSDTWHVVVDDTRAGTDVIRTVSGGSVTVPRLSMMVLYDESDDYAPELTAIEIHSPAAAIRPGDSITLQAVPRDQRGNPMSGVAINWSSSNESAAVVNASGRVTALAEGEVTITASAGAVSASVTLHVAELRPARIVIDGPDTVYATMSATLTAAVFDQFDQRMYGVSVVWQSGDTEVATVDGSGVVTALKEGEVTITASVPSADVRAEHKLVVKPYVKRYVQIRYERPDQNYTGWNLWVWYTGVRDGQIDFERIEKGGAIANVEVAPGVTRFGFLVRLNDWEAKDVEQDRYIEFDAEEEFVKVIVTSGRAEFRKIPSVRGPKLSGGYAIFYYRDPALFASGKMDEIDEVKLVFDGGTHDMAYDAENEYFHVTIGPLKEGVHEYSFLVTREGATSQVTDPYNTVNGKSVIEYSVPDVQVAPAVAPGTLDDTQNALLRVDIGGDPVRIDGVYADLSELGGRPDFPIDPELMAATIAVRDDVEPGVKTIRVTVVDEFGNRHHADAKVTVAPRTASGPLDFGFDEARIYFILTDRFFNGDPSNDNPNGEHDDKSHPETYHGGDLKGITAKLDYLKELGINTIWMTPIVDNIDHNVGYGQPWGYQYGYHGYWAKDFTKLDEHLGELSDLHELIEEAHDRGIKIMVDVVLNHAGYGLKPGDTNTHGLPNFPTDADRARFAGMIRTNPGFDDTTMELAGLPDFITEDPAVRAQIIAWQTDWLEKARTPRGDTIDYFRVDTVKHVDGTTLRAFKNALTLKDPNFKLIGESWGDSADNVLGLLRSGQMDALLDFSFKGIALNLVNGNIDAAEAALESRNAKIDNTATVGQFLSSHDEDGFLSELVGGDEGKLKVAAALQMTVKGQPVIYYGEEIGRSGKNADFGRGIEGTNRSDMPWDQVETKADLLDHYKKLLHIRGKYSGVFAKGSHAKLAGGDADGWLFFTRAYGGRTVIVGLNTAESAKTVTLDVPFEPGTEVRDEYSGAVRVVDADGRIELELPGRYDGGTVILAAVEAGDEPAAPPGGGPGTNPGGSRGTDSQPAGPNLELQPNQRLVELPQPDEGGALRIALDGGITEVIWSADAEAIGEAEALVFETAYGLTVEVPAALLEALRRPGAYFTLEIVPLREEASRGLLDPIAGREVVRLAGNVYSLRFGILDADGNRTPVTAFDRPIRLVFKADPSADPELTHVYYIDDEGALRYIPSVRSGHTLTVEADHFSLYAVIEYDKAFDDVPAGHWAERDIKRLAARQIVKGVSPTRFAPDRRITRAEFAALLARALRLEASGSPDGAAVFTDVRADAWYAADVRAAAEAGIIRGRGNGRFAPEDPITREEMAVMIMRARAFAAGWNAETPAAEPGYRDLADISEWAKDAVAQAYALGVMIGRGDGQFAPKDHATRAESAKVIAAILTP